jgi:hypothetical protein
MVPPGGDDINPERNAVQALVAVAGPMHGGRRVSTLAQFHGRPEAARRSPPNARCPRRGRLARRSLPSCAPRPAGAALTTELWRKGSPANCHHRSTQYPAPGEIVGGLR